MSKVPDYFLADLPPDAELTPHIVGAACRTLKRNRETYLLNRSAASLITTLASVARDWLEPDFPLRKQALAEGPAATGFSAATLARGLEAFFRQLTTANLTALLEQELGDPQRLDRFVAESFEQATDRAAIVSGPEFIAHVAAGTLPVSAMQSLVLGWLARSAQFLKCARGTSLIPRLFAHSVYAVDPKLAACLEIAEWPGGTACLEEVLFNEVDCVAAMGSDNTLETIRARIPKHVRFVGYGHRLSFAYVAAGMLSSLNARKVARLAATDVTAWDQLGCLSPHVIYVERGGAISPHEFAELLAAELDNGEVNQPRGTVSVEAAVTIASRRSLYELRTAGESETLLWKSPAGTHWTVVYEGDARFQVSCLHRFIYVKPVAHLEEALQAADAQRWVTSTVGIAVPEDRAEEVATRLARWGATRVCPLGRMQEPSPAWRHDGQPALGALLTWTDWER
jgi:hypothetical protein